MERRTWKEEIYDAFIALGGDAQYKDLYEYLEKMFLAIMKVRMLKRLLERR